MIVGKPLFSEEQINKRVNELAQTITKDYKGKDLLAIGILKGAFMFFSDLVRRISLPMTVDFIIASSYIGDNTTEDVKIYYETRERIERRDVLLIDDIVDTGITLNFLRERILTQMPKSLKICTLLDKKERRLVDIPLDYVGFEIPNEFVVGYGLDFDGQYRNLPYIGIYKKVI